VRITLSDLASSVGGHLASPGDGEVVVDGASIDSRTVSPGQLFVAVIAARDGHDFVAAAAEAGAAAALVARPLDMSIPQVVVRDTAAALLDAGRMARERVGAAPVVGITGSVGKTSTKDLLREALAAGGGIVAASHRSFNNELGVPVTLLDAPDGAAAVVVEMGARGVGHIALLCDVARPSIGVVTAVAAAHTELFGSVEAVAQAKGELVEALPAEGTAVLHVDPLVSGMARRTSARVLTFGGGVGDGGDRGRADVRASEVRLDETLRPSFRLHSPWGESQVRLSVAGRHQVDNALAAIAAAMAAGADLDTVIDGVSHASLSPWRMDLRVSPRGVAVLNDAYNANPTSTAAALVALVELEATRRVAIVGHMAELGTHEVASHREIAALARELGVELVAVGTNAYGVEPIDLEAAIEFAASLGPGDAVLVKGSRIAGLERVAASALDLVEE
jgi:UDP-N-acetylmuramoyl-tripeptide--D-alanyl-D-alanine ligase